jgi:hypothetical protein
MVFEIIGIVLAMVFSFGLGVIVGAIIVGANLL